MAKSSSSPSSSSGILKSVTPAVFLCAMILSFPHLGHAQLSCESIYKELLPCMGYIMWGVILEPACCTGARIVARMGKSPEENKFVCSCLKTSLVNLFDHQVKNAAKIPELCTVKIPFNITRDVDCEKMKKLI